MGSLLVSIVRSLLTVGVTHLEARWDWIVSEYEVEKTRLVWAAGLAVGVLLAFFLGILGGSATILLAVEAENRVMAAALLSLGYLLLALFLLYRLKGMFVAPLSYSDYRRARTARSRRMLGRAI